MQQFTPDYSQILSPDRTMEIVLDAINEIVEYELAVVLRLEEEDLLRVRKARGPLVTPRLKDFTISLEQRQDIADILKKGQVHLFEDKPGDEDAHLDTYDEILDMPAGHSCLVSPLHIEGNVLGLLTLDHRVCNMFTPDIVRTTQTLSRLIALALAQSMVADSLLIERDALVLERNTLLTELPQSLNDLIGNSAAWRDILEKIRMVAPTSTPVLIAGETGTGKEQVARAIHALSQRVHRPFVALNCSALTSSLAESELFGHERGAFTGAVARRKGRFEIANTGTLFLDEIGDLPLEIQPKLLRALQEQVFERVGGEKSVSADVRIICATNVDLEKSVAEGRFREDLYYRLNVFQFQLPPLREREDDIILLTQFFISKIARKFGKAKLQLSEQALAYLQTYPWPGNVRELQNTLERAAILAQGDTIGTEHLAPRKFKKLTKETTSTPSRKDSMISLDDAIRRHIEKALAQCDGRIYGPKGAAALLDVKPTTLQSKIKSLKIGN